MGIGRTILAFLIALSMALPPVISGAGAKATGFVTVTHDHDHDGTHRTGAADQCTAAAGCAFKCFTLWTPSAVEVTPAITRAEIVPLVIADIPPPQEGSPPFRPPRA